MRLLRAFIIVALVLLALVAGFMRWAAPPTAPRSLVFVGGDIITMTDPPMVDAIWIEDGRIAALGSEQEVRAAAGPDVEVADLRGTTLMPGLIEPHTHPMASAALGAAIDVSGFTHDSPEAVREALEEGVQRFAPQPWLIAFGWDPVMMPDLEPPTLAELDALSPDKPLVVLEQMMHEAYANSAALEAAGITKDTPDPPGASFGRDETGKPNGVVHELGALNLVLAAMPPVPPALSELLLRWQHGAYARAGFTTIGVLGPVGRAEDPIRMMRSLGADSSVPVRAVIYGLPKHLDADSAPDAAADSRVILRGVKFWMDGSPYTGGAAFAEPYEDSELVRDRLGLPPGHLGPLNYEPDAFAEAIEPFHRAGYRVAVHTQGERAIDRALDAIEEVLSRYPWIDHRHRLEHNALITSDQIARAQKLGVELSFFVDHIYYYGHQLPNLVGDRVERYMPLGSAMAAGHRATIHTDNPATPVGPFRAMRTAILRTPRKGGEPLGLDERIGIEQALRSMTSNAARQLGVEAHRGSLDVGKAADLVQLTRNPLDTPATELAAIEVLGTWIDGQPVDTRRASRSNLDLALQAVRQLLAF